MRFAVIAILAAACSSPSKPPTPTPVEPTPVEAVPVDAAPLEQAPPASDAGAAPVSVPALAADGASCSKHADCASGVCEGEGCTDDKPGTCAPAQRGCTRDLRTYCGCDGKTFKGSGSCPRQRYEAKGACPTGGNRKAGAFCLKATDCASKICEGKGCTDDLPGRCADKGRACTADVRQFCTCDGRTTTGSSSCPGVRYSKSATCDEDDDE